MKSRAYHHGDLHTALIEAGLKLIADRDVEALSLREVARTVGVSATAVYRHFPDKSALMAALAKEGFDRLAALQHAASEAAGGGAGGFGATGRAYIHFALANPALFRLMFSKPVVGDPLKDELGHVPEAMAFLRANAAAVSPAGSDAARVQVLALQSWAITHGVAMLMLDGQVPIDLELIDRVMQIGPRAKAPRA